MNNKYIINPFEQQKTINSFIIDSLLGVDEALNDKSNIGKMRDIYPLMLFSFNWSNLNNWNYLGHFKFGYKYWKNGK